MTLLLSLNVLLDAGEDAVAIVVRMVWYREFFQETQGSN